MLQFYLVAAAKDRQYSAREHTAQIYEVVLVPSLKKLSYEERLRQDYSHWKREEPKQIFLSI